MKINVGSKKITLHGEEKKAIIEIEFIDIM